MNSRPRRFATGSLAGIGAGLAMWLVAGSAAAQQVQLGLPPPPHYVGEAIEITITAVGFEEEPTPKVELRPPRGSRVEFAGVRRM